MTFIDLYQRDQADDLRIKPTEGTQRPAGFNEAFDAAWSDGRLFGQSIAGENARSDALQDHIADIEKRTGKNVSMDLDWQGMAIGGMLTADQMREQVNSSAEKLGVEPLTGDELERRAVEKSRDAETSYAAMAAREKTFGGKVGLFAGGLASAAADPINVLALPIAPETAEVGLLAAGLRWGAVGGLAQAGIEVAGGPYREEVQPGYLQSIAPPANVLQAAGGGFLLGAGSKALGNLWTRVKSGAWPTSIRDAGNVIESEANVANTNVYPGAIGEAAHRDALEHSISSILNGDPVDVTHIITPDLEAGSRAIMMRLEGERGIALPIFDERQIRLTSEEAGLRERQAQITVPSEGDLTAADRLNRLQAVDAQIASTKDADALRALKQRRDQILVDTTPEKLREQAGAPEQRRAAMAEQESINARLSEIANERARIEAENLGRAPPPLGQTAPSRAVPVESVRQQAIATATAADTERTALSTSPAPELPFQATAAEAEAQAISESFETGIRQIAARAGYQMPAEEAATIAQKLVKATPEDAQDMLRNLQVSPRQVAEAPTRLPVAEPRPEARTNEQVAQAISSPEYQQALRSDIDRDRMMSDRGVPVGVDEKGEPIYRSVDEAMNEVDAYKRAADEIQACAAPPQASEEAA